MAFVFITEKALAIILHLMAFMTDILFFPSCTFRFKRPRLNATPPPCYTSPSIGLMKSLNISSSLSVQNAIRVVKTSKLTVAINRYFKDFFSILV